MSGGVRTTADEPLETARDRFREDLERLPAEALDLVAPKAPVPQISDALASLAERVEHDLKVKAGRDEHGHRGA